MIKATFPYVYKDVDVVIYAKCKDVDDYAAKGLELEFMDPATEETIEVPFDEDSFDELELYAAEELLNKKEEMTFDYV